MPSIQKNGCDRAADLLCPSGSGEGQVTRIAHEWKVPDKKVASARPIAHLAAAGLILALAASPGQASALHFAQRLCGPAEPGEKLSSIPDAAALIEAGRRIESRAASLREAPETKIEAILGEAPSGSGDHPDAAAIATYCAAAGDAMRLASWGSQAQAIDYLLAAFRRAGEAGRTDLVQLSA